MKTDQEYPRCIIYGNQLFKKEVINLVANVIKSILLLSDVGITKLPLIRIQAEIPDPDTTKKKCEFQSPETETLTSPL
jgi:hypothetical protein